VLGAVVKVLVLKCGWKIIKMELANGENHQSSVTYGILQQTMELSKPDMWWTALGA
jgi:hypothetical protein